VNGADIVIGSAQFPGRQIFQKSLVVMALRTIGTFTAIGVIDIVAGGVNRILPFSLGGEYQSILTMAKEAVLVFRNAAVFNNDFPFTSYE
jgi:hypothetical protein